ncbi:penicillin-binding protein activator [Sphingosinicella sp.]|uniref:penicillin-binding protein activator n=1 Tax=Sphingosinicella sp. TaxID=1917971 RepID=UPI004037D929
MASLSLRPQARWLSPGELMRLLALALMAMVIAGCVPRTRTVTPPPPPQEEVQPTRPIGRLPADETRNRVAVLVPLSGPNAALGQSLLNAANLALLDTGGQRIRITGYDTARGAAAAANEALEDGNALFLGPLLAEDVRAVAPIARSAGVPVLSFSNDSSVGGDGVFVLGLSPGQSINRVVAFAASRGMRRFGALVPTGTYGQRAGQAFTAAVEGAQGSMVGMESYSRTPADMRAAAGRLNGHGRADAVLIADGAQGTAALVPAVRGVSPPPRLLGTELWATEGDLAANVGLRGGWFAAPTDANFGAFRTRYRARYNANPFRLASLGYDAVLLAVRIAANWPVGRRFPARELTESTGFAGVDGVFRLRRDGTAERALEVREVGATGTTVASPAPRGFD